jgi:hypothetical protein
MDTLFAPGVKASKRLSCPLPNKLVADRGGASVVAPTSCTRAGFSTGSAAEYTTDRVRHPRVVFATNDSLAAARANQGILISNAALTTGAECDKNSKLSADISMLTSSAEWRTLSVDFQCRPSVEGLRCISQDVSGEGTLRAYLSHGRDEIEDGTFVLGVRFDPRFPSGSLPPALDFVKMRRAPTPSQAGPERSQTSDKTGGR